VSEREGVVLGRAQQDQQRVELAASDGDGADEGVGGFEDRRFGDVEPLDRARSGARQLAHD
jgi:hypothetical protein